MRQGMTLELRKQDGMKQQGIKQQGIFKSRVCSFAVAGVLALSSAAGVFTSAAAAEGWGWVSGIDWDKVQKGAEVFNSVGGVDGIKKATSWNGGNVVGTLQGLAGSNPTFANWLKDNPTVAGAGETFQSLSTKLQSEGGLSAADAASIAVTYVAKDKVAALAGSNPNVAALMKDPAFQSLLSSVGISSSAARDLLAKAGVSEAELNAMFGAKGSGGGLPSYSGGFAGGDETVSLARQYHPVLNRHLKGSAFRDVPEQLARPASLIARPEQPLVNTTALLNSPLMTSISRSAMGSSDGTFWVVSGLTEPGVTEGNFKALALAEQRNMASMQGENLFQVRSLVSGDNTNARAYDHCVAQLTRGIDKEGKPVAAMVPYQARALCSADRAFDKSLTEFTGLVDDGALSYTASSLKEFSGEDQTRISVLDMVLPLTADATTNESTRLMRRVIAESVGNVVYVMGARTKAGAREQEIIRVPGNFASNDFRREQAFMRYMSIVSTNREVCSQRQGMVSTEEKSLIERGMNSGVTNRTATSRWFSRERASLGFGEYDFPAELGQALYEQFSGDRTGSCDLLGVSRAASFFQALAGAPMADASSYASLLNTKVPKEFLSYYIVADKLAEGVMLEQLRDAVTYVRRTSVGSFADNKPAQTLLNMIYGAAGVSSAEGLENLIVRHVEGMRGLEQEMIADSRMNASERGAHFAGGVQKDGEAKES
jgi:hypothetical protein